MRVARAIRPNPTKPAVRFGEEGVVLSWVPQKAKGDQERVGHLSLQFEKGLKISMEGIPYFALLNESRGFLSETPSH